MQCGPWVGSEEAGEMLAVTVHSVEGNVSRVGPWAPPPPISHRVSQRCRPLPPNLGVAPSHRPPKGLWGKARSQWEARPFRAASAGRDLIPHGAARPPANGSCWQSAACSRAPHGDLGPGPHLGLRRCQPGWPGAGRPSGATAPTRLGPGPPTHAGGGGAGRGGGGWNSAGLQETDAPRGSGWQGSSGPGRVEAPHPPRPPPVPQWQAGGRGLEARGPLCWARGPLGRSAQCTQRGFLCHGQADQGQLEFLSSQSHCPAARPRGHMPAVPCPAPRPRD